MRVSGTLVPVRTVKLAGFGASALRKPPSASGADPWAISAVASKPVVTKARSHIGMLLNQLYPIDLTCLAGKKLRFTTGRWPVSGRPDRPDRRRRPVVPDLDQGSTAT